MSTEVYRDAAKHVMFGTEDSLASLESRFGLILRKGKTFEDVKAAIQRGFKQGMGRTEFEIGMVELQLKGVLKIKPATKVK